MFCHPLATYLAAGCCWGCKLGWLFHGSVSLPGHPHLPPTLAVDLKH